VLKVKSMSGMSAEKTRRFPEWVLKALLPCLRATPIGQVSQEKDVENFILLKLHVRVSRGMGVES
jgi:prophage antirepressor-like protein